MRGKSVLVTRPQHQSSGLVERIELLGGTARQLPVIAIQALDDGQVEKQKVLDLDQYDSVIVVSGNAATIGLDWIDRFWPQLPPHLNWFAVGNATARILRQFGLVVAVPAQGFNSEALLAMPELQSAQGQKILIIKGVGGRTMLEESLTAKGAQVDTLSLYRRFKPSYSVTEIRDCVGDRPLDAIVVTSVESLQNMQEILAPAVNDLLTTTLVTASERITRRAAELGFQRIVTAQGASDDAIIDALNVIA